jgi:hypothetical protein
MHIHYVVQYQVLWYHHLQHFATHIALSLPAMSSSWRGNASPSPARDAAASDGVARERPMKKARGAVWENRTELIRKLSQCEGKFTWETTQSFIFMADDEAKEAALDDPDLATQLTQLIGEPFWLIGFMGDKPVYRQKTGSGMLFLWFFQSETEGGWYASREMWNTVKQSHAMQTGGNSPVAWIGGQPEPGKTKHEKVKWDAMLGADSNVHCPFNNAKRRKGVSVVSQLIMLEEHIEILQRDAADRVTAEIAAQAKGAGKGGDKGGVMGGGKGGGKGDGKLARGGWAQRAIDLLAFYGLKKAWPNASREYFEQLSDSIVAKYPWVKAAIRTQQYRFQNEQGYADTVASQAD